MKNYWKMSGISICSVPYVFVDHYTYQADRLFAKNNVRVRYTKEMEREDSPYCIIFCRVAKKDVKKFEEVLSKLENKMLLLGHKDYPEICDRIANIFI